MGVLVRELAALYAAFAGRRGLRRCPSCRSSTPTSPSGSATGCAARCSTAQLAYWRRRLAGAPALLELPTDRPRPAVQRFRGGRRAGSASARSCRTALRRLGRRQGATLFMTLLAAFQALLRRYTGQEDIVVGTPVAGRGRVELEPLIGFFVNTLVLRSRPARRARRSATCSTACARASLEAYGHQDLPFEKLVEELRAGARPLAARRCSRCCSGAAERSRGPLELPGLTLRRSRGVEADDAKFDLSLSFAEAARGSVGALEVQHRSVRSARRRARCRGHFERLLLAAAAGSDRGASAELPLLSRRRAPAAPGVERHARRTIRGAPACTSVRGAGGAHAGGGGRVLRGRAR